uniref:Uncharacterized protein n=1 Tax=Trichobilharzia regenti TaxID=157069 RepID=A0AA85K8H8_TRIRE|nr:unnamed protein product [Trichobilharzia regenti]
MSPIKSTLRVIILAGIQIAEFVGFILFLHLFPDFKTKFTAYNYVGFVLLGLAYPLTVSFVSSVKLYGTFPINTILLIINAALLGAGFGLLMYINSLAWTCGFLAGDFVFVCIFLAVGSRIKFFNTTLVYILTVLLAIAVFAISVIAATKKIPWIDDKAVCASIFVLSVLLLLIEGHNMSTEEHTYALAALLIFVTYVIIYYATCLIKLKYLPERPSFVAN